MGYVRVSTVTQNTDRQLEGIALDKVFREYCSAKTVSRPVWEQCLDHVREGDTLHIHSLDRVCRSGAGDAVAIVDKLNSLGVSIVFHKEGLTFSGAMTAAQKGVLGILASVAQMERELINERRIEGIEAARAKGKTFGRPKTVKVTKEDVERLVASGLSKIQVAKELGIGRATLYRLLET
ncbi:hypothetical protein SOPP22_10930 [Shewanella sp. OPT22]|nr:hypothetical protein SOPP22_10930 [Shewanella sp. OPT22]